ncbi:cyclic nucleotide-gated cation channel beta-1-like isoform X3 [Halichondria panicea]|uniref:cyclic nucleotide-gated cation channel beta-1-like isoform X3 n=1 Tax=Halichondria panicea TaxID=6063 RepID=UPI00312B4B0E
MKSHTEPAVAPDDSQLSPDDDSSQTLYNSAGLKVKSFIRRCIEKYRTSGASHESNGRSLLSLELECGREVENGARRRSFVVQLRKHIFADTLKRFLPHLKFLKYHINPYGFPVQTGPYLPAWLFFDYLTDTVYIMDIVLVQFHLSWRVQGVLEVLKSCNTASYNYSVMFYLLDLQPDLKVLAKRYISRWKFWFDFLACLPLYVIPVLRYRSLLRLPRLLKAESPLLFRHRVEIKIRYPHHFRMIRLFFQFFYAIHVYTCVYHHISLWQGIGSTKWVYDGNGTAYLRCFYWATVTVVTSHNLDRGPPSNAVEYIGEMVAYLIGVFILALIIGEIRNITEAASAHKTEAYQKWDRVKEYLHHYHIPQKLQDKIRSWYENVLLTEEYLLDESKLVNTLPVKMKADLAIHTHLETLSKVALLRDCEKAFLLELVLKLRPLLFLPGDFICRKGEIGREMYIVNQGQVQVMGGTDNQVLAELGAGAVFGEINLLGLGGGNRRTVHIRSKGFSKLFSLSRADLQRSLVDYPEAQEILSKRSHTDDNVQTEEVEREVNETQLSLRKCRRYRRVTPAVRHSSFVVMPTSYPHSSPPWL